MSAMDLHSPVSEPGDSPGECAADERFRCPACGDVIGVYEPLVVSVNSHARTSSRAAEPELELEALGGRCYHHECYEQQLSGGS